MRVLTERSRLQLSESGSDNVLLRTDLEKVGVS